MSPRPGERRLRREDIRQIDVTIAIEIGNHEVVWLISDPEQARLAEPAVADDTSQRAETQELRAALAGAIERLTESQRGVLIAKVYDGLTFAQIAAELNLAVPTVKTHYLRALSAVRSHLSKTAVPTGSNA